MIKDLWLVFLFFLSIPAFAQTDSAFTTHQLAPIIGKASIDYKRQVVSLKEKQHNLDLRFNEITELRSETGKYYVGRNLREEAQLLVLLIQGTYSLLYQEKTRIFYVETEESLKIVSQKHIKLALPLIFGQQTIDQFSQKTNQTPEYSFGYLKKLTSYANEVFGSKQVVFQQNFKQFRPKIHIGPYIGININRVFMIDVTQNTTTDEYFTTSTYKTVSAPIGVSVNLETSARIGWELNVYYNKVKMTNLSNDVGGLSQMLMVGYYSIPKSYKQILKLDEFSYQSVTIDLSMLYFLIKKSKARLSPYLSLGPSLSIMTDEVMTLGSRSIGSDKVERYFAYRWNDANKKNTMFALNGGVGLNYQISRRIEANVFAKYQRGRFPRILHHGNTVANENPSDTNPNENGYDYSYDQYTNTFCIGGAVVFKVL